MRERKARKPLRREQLLDAAKARFAQHGLKRTTLDQILGDLNLTKPALYYYFQSKEELFAAVLEREISDFYALIKKAVDREDDPKDKLRVLFRKKVEILKRKATLNKLNRERWEEIVPFLHSEYGRYYSLQAGLVREIIEEGNRRGTFAVADPEHTAPILLSAFHSLEGMWFFSESRTTFLQRVDVMMETVLNGLLAR